MPETIRFMVPGEPRASRRRFRVAGGRPSTYQDEHTQRYRERIAAAYLAAVGRRAPHDGPVALEVSLYLPIPVSRPRWWRELAASTCVPCTAPPDLDNVAKCLQDTLTDCGLWSGDHRVFGLVAHKWYAREPRTEIVVSLLDPPSRPPQPPV